MSLYGIPRQLVIFKKEHKNFYEKEKTLLCKFKEDNCSYLS